MPIQKRQFVSSFLLTKLTFNGPNIMLQVFRVTGDWWLDRMTRREIPVSTLPLPTLVTYQLTLSPVASAWALCHQGVTRCHECHAQRHENIITRAAVTSAADTDIRVAMAAIFAHSDIEGC